MLLEHSEKIIVKRPRFCWYESMGSLPAKMRSNISILTVYDTYGLEICLTFINYLWKVKAKENPTWTESYVRDSYHAVGLDDMRMRTMSAVQVATLIVAELRRLDGLKTKGIASPCQSR